MFENHFHISQLIKGYLRETLNTQEQQELHDWVSSSAEHQSFFKDFLNEQNLSAALKEYNALDEDLLWDTTFRKIQLNKPRSLKYKYLFAAAAIVTIFLGIGLFYYVSSQKINNNSIVYQEKIQPGKQAATLVLASGQKIIINDVSNGTITTQSGVKISKTAEGQILYEVIDLNNGKLEYNTLYTVNGQQTQVLLPDGSSVFLNAASSLKYPTSFSKQTKREVQLSGEGYFEIAKDKTKPFTVLSRGQKVEVLGTHFNINAYTEDAVVKTTLLEGALKINNQVVLKPGQQSVVKNNKIDVQDADLEEAVAWKNGNFVFNPDNFEQTMNMIARWYNVEIVYDYKPVNLHLAANISRSRNLTEVLKIIQNTEDVKFKIEGRRVRVIK